MYVDLNICFVLCRGTRWAMGHVVLFAKAPGSFLMRVCSVGLDGILSLAGSHTAALSALHPIEEPMTGSFGRLSLWSQHHSLCDTSP